MSKNQGFSNELMAYSLQNAIEFGKAIPGKILPKLFQHGLKKEDIGKIMPAINESVKKVNSMSDEERVEAFEKFKGFVKEHVQEERDLPELPGISGKPIFRMAPFPSGALHIGNAKTYLLNAIYSERYDGKLVLVMDDTIGSEEKQPIKEAYGLIEDAFKLLKINYSKPIVYKSDRLKIYYDYAEKLIKKDKAYVCFCTQAEFKRIKDAGQECGCRRFPQDVHLLRWKELFKMEEGHGVLRIKTDMQHPNPAFRDRVLFKISDRKHPRVGEKYRIWPTLEMSWAIDDHLLGITHIIRGNDLVMESEMERYIWDIFSWKHPEIIHTGLIKIDGAGAKVSKSKAQKEVQSGEFMGWNDPRTWSVQSLIERGITAEAINEFVKEIGLNRQDITVPIEALYAANRRIIDSESLRYSFILNPVKLDIKNNPEVKEVKIPVHPDKKDMRSVEINDIYIQGNDANKYFGKKVRLLHLFNVKIDKKSEVDSIDIEDAKKMPKINWVSEHVKARILMPNGEWIEGIAEKDVSKLKSGEMIQFERFGFVKYHGKKNDAYEFWFAHG
ncbi:glutamate--tRNA ligase [Candidatus Pacearchaeota archaeon CG10_big_fil_rev_8_21_14_0_10_34_76]|nr:MAG: glutamate--tRNA ligase [Candidatus Pacearchaeota archaeon CG10_big_fil_rev_8_21_14_0_10_34_76]